jgi:hypothetical protein
MAHKEIISYCLQKHQVRLVLPFDPIYYPVVKVKAPLQDKGANFCTAVLSAWRKLTLYD